MGFLNNVKQESSISTASGSKGLHYVVLQVTLKEKFFGTGSGNLTELEDVINKQVAKDIDYIQSALLMVEVKALVVEIEFKLQWFLKRLYSVWWKIKSIRN